MLREILICVSGEATMFSVYECGSVVPGCRFVAHSESRDEVLVTAIEHLHRVHEIEELSDSLKARIRAIIREAPADASRSRAT
jgi:predicted small metal-binding protein